MTEQTTAEPADTEPADAEMADAGTVALRVRYFAGARAARGVTEEELTVPCGTSVAVVLATLTDRHGSALARVLGSASVLLDGTAVRDRSVEIAGGAELDVLPPFAGG